MIQLKVPLFLAASTVLNTFILTPITWAENQTQTLPDSSVVREKSSSQKTSNEKQIDLVELARESYVFMYPIVMMDATMRQATSVPDTSTIQGRAPINTFAHFRSYPSGDSRDIVRFNFDTLYSFAWLNLAKEPVILSVPEVHDRYYLIPALDMWTDVFSSIGTRTTGNGEGHFAYVGPDWDGPLPAGVKRIDAPTNQVWLMGRVQTNGEKDFANVHKIQDNLILTPLSQWKSFDSNQSHNAVNAKTHIKPSNVEQTNQLPPMVEVNRLTGVEFFKRSNELIKNFSMHLTDSPIKARMSRFGVDQWGTATLSTEETNAINEGAKLGLADIARKIQRGAMKVNGWAIMNEFMGVYGSSYLHRAAITMGGIGANLQEDSVYPTAFVDADGIPLDGKNRYRIRFPKGATPPCDAFWSLTMYDEAGFQVPNELNRYCIGSRDPLRYNEDGSLDIYIQHERPASDLLSNWLPAPASGQLGPTLRIYAPHREILDGDWMPPAIEKLNSAKQ